MNFINFSYKNYVQNGYQYYPKAWPPDIKLAEFHSRCTRPGDPLMSQIQCPCCYNFLKKKETTWLNRNVFEDFVRTSSGICGYFILLRSFCVVSFWLVLLGAIYQWIIISDYCTQQSNRINCFNIGPFYFVDFLNISQQFLRQKHILVGLAIGMQYMLLVANIVILNNLINVKKQCEGIFTHNTVLVSDANQEELNYFLQEKDLKNFYVISLSPIYKEFKLRKDAVHIFFKIMTHQALQYKLESLNKLYNSLDKKFIQIGQEEFQKPNYQQTNFLLTFKYDYDAKRFIKLSKLKSFSSLYLKYPEDMRWKMSGQPISKVKFLRALFNLIVIIVVMTFLLYVPLKYDYELEQKSLNELTIFQFVECYAISILFSVACFFYDMLVKRESRHLMTHTSKSERVLMFNIIFALIFYIFLPSIFTLVMQSHRQGILIYVIVEQAAVVMIMQVLVSIVDPNYYLWNTQKSLLLGDTYESMQYNQQQLNKKVQCIKYPILNKLMTYFRVYAFCFAFTIISPYVSILLFISSFLLFAFQKRNIYNHYKSNELNIAVIIYSFMYFSIICDTFFAGYLSAFIIIKFQMPWVYIIPSIIGFFVLQGVKIFIYKKRYSVDNDEDILQQDLSYQLAPDSNIRPSNLASLREVTNYDSNYQTFIGRMRDKSLFSEITEYLNYYNSMKAYSV